MQPWVLDFDTTEAKMKSSVASIRLHGMSLNYHKRYLQMIGQMVGCVFRIDYTTETAARENFLGSQWKFP